jgi:hypothetical protein
VARQESGLSRRRGEYQPDGEVLLTKLRPFRVQHVPVRERYHPRTRETGPQEFFLVNADYALGRCFARDATVSVEAAGGTILGSMFHPPA